MFFSDFVYVGIEPASGHKDFSYAALDSDLNLLALADADMDDLAAFLGGQRAAVAAVDAPSRVNAGLLREKLESQSLTPGHALRGVDMRLSEYDLRARGIFVGGTPAREETCPVWVQAGLALYRKLAEMGFQPYRTDEAKHQVLETNSHACFCVLLEQIPFSKPTLEGRLQRQLALYECGLRIKDPMDFFEEITRFKLKKGILPVHLVYVPEHLDALAAAYTAWLAVHKPDEVLAVGDSREGLVILPVKELKEKY
ncbi:MAG: hypothetical protein Fur0043_16570 [Anaerolineales bacterium]